MHDHVIMMAHMTDDMTHRLSGTVVRPTSSVAGSTVLAHRALPVYYRPAVERGCGSARPPLALRSGPRETPAEPSEPAALR